jgi:Lactate racemase N-terminal domain
VRVPLISGTRLVVAAAPEEAVVLRPRAPGEGVADVVAAVRDALRFPLEGESLETLVGRGTRATIVVEPPALPIPAATSDPRQAAVSAVVTELEQLGVPTGYQTFLVAPGLARRTSQRELESFVTPELARGFHGNVVVHDVEDPELVQLDDVSRPPLRVNRALVETDLVVVVSAAESVLHGGPSTLLGAAGADALRAAGARSLLETRGSQGWLLALALEAIRTRTRRWRASRARPCGTRIAFSPRRCGGMRCVRCARRSRLRRRSAGRRRFRMRRRSSGPSSSGGRSWTSRSMHL